MFARSDSGSDHSLSRPTPTSSAVALALGDSRNRDQIISIRALGPRGRATAPRWGPSSSIDSKVRPSGSGAGRRESGHRLNGNIVGTSWGAERNRHRAVEWHKHESLQVSGSRNAFAGPPRPRSMKFILLLPASGRAIVLGSEDQPRFGDRWPPRPQKRPARRQSSVGLGDIRSWTFGGARRR